MAFKVGQKVVCVDTNWGEHHSSDPVLNEIVEIDRIDFDGYLYLKGKGVFLKGGEEWINSYGDEHFRPLEEVFSEQSDFDLYKIEQEIEREQLVPVEW